MTFVSLLCRLWLLGLMVCLMSGCASLSNHERILAAGIARAAKSNAVTCSRADHCAMLAFLPGHDLTKSSTVAKDPQHYAMILDQGEDALVVRLNLIGAAKDQIDVQTYIFDKDDSSRVILDALLAAARRGVKVRVLIDQLSAIEDLHILAALSGIHQNFSLRIYNPTFGKAKLSYFDYALSVLCCFHRFNQRMHNKLLVVDRTVGIVGGRNFQNDYFNWDADYNFRDRDVLIVGPAVEKMQENFNVFWQAKRSVSVDQLNDVGSVLLKDGVPALPKAQFVQAERVRRVINEAASSRYLQKFFADHILPVRQVEYYADVPGKHRRHFFSKSTPDAKLDDIISHAKSQIILQTPYLVISKPAARLFRRLHRSHLPPQIIVSTNSLAATDNPIVYTLSYKYKRRNVKELGFNIFEFKPFPRDPPYSMICHGRCDPANKQEDIPLVTTEASSTATLSDTRHQPRAETRLLLNTHASQPLPVMQKGTRMGLHAKSLVVDNEIGVIGTHNFDPRSENYNTEGVVIVRDETFARVLAQSILRDISPQNAWTVAPRRRQRCSHVVAGRCLDRHKGQTGINFWPWRYATDYEFRISSRCPTQLFWYEPDFYACSVAVGDFPDVNVGPKWLFVHMLSAVGAGLVPIL